MNIDNNSRSRRRFIKVALVGAAGLQIAALGRAATAAALPHRDEADGSAKALAYAHDAATVAADLRGGENRVCSTCRFYIKPAAEWGPCTLFPGKAAAAKGWCKGWVTTA